MNNVAHSEKLHFDTNAIHAGQDPNQWTSRAIIPPISMSTTFLQKSPADHYGFKYSRSGNPTRNCLEACLAALEHAEYGLAYSSGLAATHNVTQLLQIGDHILSFDDLYGGTSRLFRTCVMPRGIDVSFVDCTDLKKVEADLKPNTKLVWIETPSNPLMKVVDIKAVCNIVKQKSSALVAVDNTFMSAHFQKPLLLGADIVLHSLTKYMNGHSDVVMGALCTNHKDVHERLRYCQNATGAVPSPFDCFLVNRGLKTLHVRMERHMQNGLAVAHYLEKHPSVEKVLHPGLPSHPQYEIAKKQCSGFSGMVSFYIKGGLKEGKDFLSNLNVFSLAESLGGIESLAELPSVMTHASVPPDQRKELGITDNLVRLSVGIEHIDDLIQDLDQALKKAVSSTHYN
ncbi:cystathionine gamma-lyase-like isoform X2 [Ornithodoros turicata]|uniref:cystathionine gamma-lyase-like isoform X2 n=1 Tax=Ornithodoros turicata TaxID=34597 RepID=UPI00313990EF